MAVETLEKPAETDVGDNSKVAHICDKNEITRSYVEGTPLRALCGKVWVPSRDPKNYPVCAMCKEIFEQLTGVSYE